MDEAAALLGLDHVVIAVHDLEQTIADYRALGFTVTPGGRHPGRTSHNALVVFADGAYLELISWTAPAPQERWWRTLQAHGEGYVDFALLPQNTVAALHAAQARGLHTLIGPVDGGRLRPDGARLQWQTARHSTPDLPFLCGDITPRDLRVPTGAARQHANGALGVAALEVAVETLDSSLARYRALLGPQVAIDEQGRSDDGLIESASFVVCRCRIQLTAPTEQTTADHALKQHLATRGQGPVRMVLHAAAGAAQGPLPLQGAHQATIDWC